MPKCPECGREIDSLFLYTDSIRCFKAFNNHGVYDEEEIGVEDESIIHYACPLCGIGIFYSHESAKKFLLYGEVERDAREEIASKAFPT